jgi:hypothetical protein
MWKKWCRVGSCGPDAQPVGVVEAGVHRAGQAMKLCSFGKKPSRKRTQATNLIFPLRMMRSAYWAPLCCWSALDMDQPRHIPVSVVLVFAIENCSFYVRFPIQRENQFRLMCVIGFRDRPEKCITRVLLIMSLRQGPLHFY